MTKKMFKMIIPAFVLGFGVLLSGCALMPSQKDYQVEESAESPIKTLKGSVKVAGGLVYISSDGITTEITSHKIDLNKYNGQEIEVTGQFSGTVLYVDEVK